MGFFAHIYPASQAGGPRFDPSYPTEKLADEENGILLCGTHHKIIDDHPDHYTVNLLKKMKHDHENFVRRQMIEDMSNVGFPQIALLLQHLESSPDCSAVNWDLVKLDEKINKNKLSSVTCDYLKIGLLKVNEVKQYIESVDLITPDYSEKIKQVFFDRYSDIKGSETDPDKIFSGLLTSIEGETPGLGKRAAALAVLTYLFERCEVFEK